MMKRELFKVEGGKIVRLRKNCPKCGDGVFLAEHKDRLSCGQCGYTEFKGKRERPVEERKEEVSIEKPIVEPETPEKTEKEEITEQPKEEKKPEEKVEETEKPAEEEPSSEKPPDEEKTGKDKPEE
jgi:small subunit ribosomal protein S27Ae